VSRAYRYRLSRRWRPGERVVAWVMLNPSTADGWRDDPTIRRCIALSRAHGFDALVVVNLFALRATDPRVLRVAADPVGAGNERAIARAVAGASAVVVAWGVHGALYGRGGAIAAWLAARGVPVTCLGRTKDGSPRHPLYVRRDARLVPFAEGRSAEAARGGAMPKDIRRMSVLSAVHS
jgi:hypothetical protein